MPRLLFAMLAAAAFLAAPVAFAQTLSRAEALQALEQSNAAQRRLAARSLSAEGRMADVPALLSLLSDGDEEVRTLAEQSIWAIWGRSGDERVDRLYAEGVNQMQSGLAAEAIATFSRIIELKPEFAEGWNKRATVYFLMGEYQKSLADCDEVLKRNPTHFGVLSGYGQIYLQLNEPERALSYFERALAVNPNMEQVERVIEELKGQLMQQKKDTT